MKASNPRDRAVHCAVRTPTNALLSIQPPPALTLACDNCTDRYERSLNCSTFSPELGSQDHQDRPWGQPGQDGPRDSDGPSDSAGKPAAWPRFAPSDRAAG